MERANAGQGRLLVCVLVCVPQVHAVAVHITLEPKTLAPLQTQASEQTLTQAAERINNALKAQFKSLQQAFKRMDLDRDGRLSRQVCSALLLRPLLRSSPSTAQPPARLSLQAAACTGTLNPISWYHVLSKHDAVGLMVLGLRTPGVPRRSSEAAQAQPAHTHHRRPHQTGHAPVRLPF